MVLIVLTFVWDLVAARREPPEVPVVEAEWDPMAGGHPVPPMPGQQPADGGDRAGASAEDGRDER